LSVAHSIGIIHRDVKPANIFVTQQEVPKLLDFGIAKLVDASAESITARGVAVGTPRYMSPEQAAGDPVDARADLYAVGLVLYEMISGAGPYRASDANELFLAHLTQPAPALSTQARGVSLELDAIVASLLAKQPAERPQSAKSAAQALRAVLALYLKPGRTPLASASASDVAAASKEIPAPSKRASAAPATAPIDEVATRPGDVQQVLEATTKRFDPKAVQSTHAGETAVDGRLTVDERARRGNSPSQPPQADTVMIDEPGKKARRSDRPPAGNWAPETRTASVPPVAAAAAVPAELGVTPPARRAKPTVVGCFRLRCWCWPWSRWL
jgi:serine/threonine-protein kinase